jgi:hypothetical protein
VGTADIQSISKIAKFVQYAARNLSTGTEILKIADAVLAALDEVRGWDSQRVVRIAGRLSSATLAEALPAGGILLSAQ